MGLFSSLIGNAGTVEPEKLKEDYKDLFLDDEEVEIGFQVIRDTFIFTTKRLIIIDKQGMTGKKIDILSIDYGSISRFSVETSGNFDLDAELKIWISGEPQSSIQKQFNKKVNVYDVQKVLAKHALS